MLTVTRQFPQSPIVAVGVVVLDGDRVLLIKRGQAPLNGHWSLPGGAQHLGEDVRATARREVKEETGLEITLGGLIDVLDFVERDEMGRIRHHYTLIDFVARPAGNKTLKPGDDARAAAWFKIDRLDSLGLWQETVRIIHLALANASQGKAP